MKLRQNRIGKCALQCCHAFAFLPSPLHSGAQWQPGSTMKKNIHIQILVVFDRWATIEPKQNKRTNTKAHKHTKTKYIYIYWYNANICLSICMRNTSHHQQCSMWTEKHACRCVCAMRSETTRRVPNNNDDNNTIWNNNGREGEREREEKCVLYMIFYYHHHNIQQYDDNNNISKWPQNKFDWWPFFDSLKTYACVFIYLNWAKKCMCVQERYMVKKKYST